MVFSLDETCCVSSCVVLRCVAALNFIFPVFTTPLSAQAFLSYDVLETTASSYLKVPIITSEDNATLQIQSCVPSVFLAHFWHLCAGVSSFCIEFISSKV